MPDQHSNQAIEQDILVDAPPSEQVVPPALPAFRRLQAIAVAVGLFWLVAGFFISHKLILAAQNNWLYSLNSFSSSETDYISSTLDQEFNQAEQLAATLSLQENIVSRIIEINKLSTGLRSFDARTRYDQLITHPDAHNLNIYLTRLATALDIPRMYLLDKNGLCVVASQWRDPHACIGGNYEKRDYYQKSISDGSAMQFAVGLQVRDPSFFFSSAIRHQGAFLGAAIVRLNSNELLHFFARDAGLSVVIDRHGMVVVSTSAELILNHLGPTFGTAPDANLLKSIYALDSLITADISTSDAHHFELELWRYKDVTYLMSSAQIGNRDLRVIRLIPVPQLEEIRRESWVLALAAISIGLMMIIFVERNLNFTAHRKAHLATLAAANTNLNNTAHKLYELAICDSLTGLRNHRFFMHKLDEEIAFAYANQSPLALIVMDIDHFKKINDTYGHPVGDQVICSLAQSCKEIVRACDTVGRLGGEEFAILLPQADLHNAETIARRIQLWCQEQYLRTQGNELNFTCSFGVAALMPDWDAKELLHAVDSALYSAKANGRNCVVTAPECLMPV